MNALIVGGAGFVGNYLVDAIKEELRCNVCVTKSKHHRVFCEDVKFRDLDVLDKDAMETLIEEEKPDYIFHLAAQSSIYQSWQKPAETVNVNVMGSLHLLNAVRQSGRNPVVIMVGSGEEYGLTALKACPISEEHMLLPQNIYAATKACQNMMASVYHAAYGTRVIMVRAFNHVGPGQSDRFVISDFCHQVARIEKGISASVIRTGNLEAKRDFTDVRDVVRAYTKLAQFGYPGETYNVGSGHAVEIRKVLEMILQKAKTEIVVEQDPAKVRPIEAPIIKADIRKIYAATGWQPHRTLSMILDDMLDYWRRQEA